MFKFLKLIKAESKNITWPSRKLVMIYSVLVILVSVMIALYIFASDTGLKKGLLKLQDKFQKQQDVKTN